MVHLPLLHRSRGSATSAASDSGAGPSGITPAPVPVEDGVTMGCADPATSYLGKLWHWGGESFTNHGGVFGSRASQVLLLPLLMRSNRSPQPSLHTAHATMTTGGSLMAV